VTNDTDTFVQEVDESLRQDRMLTLGKKYGPWLLGVIIAIIVGVLIWQGWESYQVNQSREHAPEYAAAQALAREGNFEGARDAFAALRNEGPQVYRTMAALEYAAMLEQLGDLEAALTAFDEAAEAARDPVMRETAQLRAAYIAADTQDFAALQARLQPLIESESRLSYLARELLGFEAWEAGQTDLARDTLENLTLAFDAPQEVQQRAQLGLSVIGPAPATPADGATAPAPAEGETP
jgi:hypothetical protein